MNIQGVRPNMLAAAPTQQSPTTSPTPSSTVSSNSSLSQSDFLKLIATELQAQDPTQPLDPSQFMGQMVQFGTLNEVTSIYNLLSNGAAASATTGSSSASPTAANAGQVSSIPSK